jgi:hypothetical protein
LGVSCIECLALVSGWEVENLDDLNVGWLGVFITPTTKLAVWWRLSVAWCTGQSGAHRIVSGVPATSPGRWVLTVGALTAGEAPLKIPEGAKFGLESPGAPDSPVRQTRAAFGYPLLSLLNPFLGLFIG